MVNEEKEIKYLISEEDYYKLVNFFNKNNYHKIKSINQINYYLDSNKLELSDKGITARIRELSINSYEFTIKVPSNLNYGNNIKVNNEYNLLIDKSVVQEILQGGELGYQKNNFEKLLKEYDLGINFESLKIIGKLETLRQFYKIDNQFNSINIDISSYLGVKDYEIEWETCKIEEADKILKNILFSNDIDILGTSSSKYKRFLRELLKMEKQKIN